MKWYEKLSEIEIVDLKENKIPLGLCDGWMWTAFVNLFKESPNDIQMYFGSSRGWDRSFNLKSECVYRLNPTWSKPISESDDKNNLLSSDRFDGIAWANTNYIPTTGQNLSKTTDDKWEYCSVYLKGRSYKFNRSTGFSYFLNEAGNIPGFGGIEFKEQLNAWHFNWFWFNPNTQQIHSLSFTEQKDMPSTPNRVRFLLVR